MTTLKQRIKDEMKAALLSGDRFVGDTLRNLGAAILDEEVKQGVREAGLDDAAVEQVIVREVKKRRDAAAIYRTNGRPELAEPEEREMAVLQHYLPQPLSDEELQAVVTQTIAELGADNPRMTGQVIGAVKAKVGNRADGGAIAQLVQRALAP